MKNVTCPVLLRFSLIKRTFCFYPVFSKKCVSPQRCHRTMTFLMPVLWPLLAWKTCFNVLFLVLFCNRRASFLASFLLSFLCCRHLASLCTRCASWLSPARASTTENWQRMRWPMCNLRNTMKHISVLTNDVPCTCVGHLMKLQIRKQTIKVRDASQSMSGRRTADVSPQEQDIEYACYNQRARSLQQKHRLASEGMSQPATKTSIHISCYDKRS